ncbi:MAG TPA: CBS domain-containing protein [Gemmatimonadaceae bacterium]|nr:CBS domain-containing protein [Gemmatimonadaceae bacterium]
MLKLRDIMTTDVLTVTPETSVLDAMDLLGRRHVSGAPVVSGGTLVGVVTATDLMAFASSLSGVPTERELHDEWGIWGEESVEEEVEQEAEPASAFFSELWDDAGADTAERMAHVSGPEWNVLAEHDVSEVMTRTPLATLPPDADVESAADLMRRDAIHRVLVTDGGTLVGIVSALDVARAAAEHKLTRRTYVFNRDGDFSDFR